MIQRRESDQRLIWRPDATLAMTTTKIPTRYEVNVTSQKGDVVLRGEIRLNISSESLRAEVYTLLHDHMRQLLAEVETWL